MNDDSVISLTPGRFMDDQAVYSMLLLLEERSRLVRTVDPLWLLKLFTGTTEGTTFPRIRGRSAA
eukprot:12005449-Prorocentrum_lima.AAC.1